MTDLDTNRPLRTRRFIETPWDLQALIQSRQREQAHITTHFQTLNARGPVHVTLIACSAGKLNHPAPAKDLYTGQLFQKSRAYAEKTGNPYFILSALHGLLDPHKITAPYNCTLKVLRSREREGWGNRVVDSIVWTIPAASTITILAGNNYSDPIETKLKLKGFTVERPLKGLGIGRQQQRLVQMMKAIT